MKKKMKISREELNILYLPERLSALEVAKKIRVPLKANYTNYFDLDLTPYIKLPVSLIGRNVVEWIYVIGCTQSAKTVFLQIVVADSIDQDPGTLIYTNPDETLSKKGMKEKIINMIDESPFLKKHSLGIKKISKTGIELDNMTIYPAWAGSLGTLSSIPAKRVILDEARLMKLQIGDESNAIKLAGDRLTTFKNMGLAQGYVVSTPSVEGDLLHQQLTIPGTVVLYWHVRCEKCNTAVRLDFFKNIRLIEINGKKEPKCVCLNCGHYFNDSGMKRKMNSTGFYATEKGESFELVQKLPKRIVFWYDSMVSPFRSFKAIWNEFIETKDKLHDYRNFVQCWLARFWVEDISKTSEEELSKRKHPIEKIGVIPSWTKVITAGIDTQDSGFYVVVRAWGEGLRTRLVDAYFISCKMYLTDFEDIKKLLKRDVEDRFYVTKENIKWQIGLTAIDTGGHRTKDIYKATKELERMVWVKGARGDQKVTIQYSKDYNLYLVRTNEYLDETEEISFKEKFELPSNIHKDYLNQFINVRKVKKRNKETGEETTIWKKVGQYDYRYAEVHAFICLDIETSVGYFRNQLNDPGFSYNPVSKKVEESAKISMYEEGIENNDVYDIGTFKEGW